MSEQPSTDTPWRHLPHGPLEALAPDLWVVTGSLPGNNPLPRNMVVWKGPDNGLLIHSAVNLDERQMIELETIGTPRWLVVPNRFHRMDAPAWKARYPDVTVLAPKAVVSHVEEKVPVDATMEDTLPPLGITCHVPDGTKPDELWLEIPVGDAQHALVCTDTLFNCREHLPGVGGFLMRYVTGSTGHFGTTRLSRMLLVRDRKALQGWLSAQAERPGLVAVVVGHGPPVALTRGDDVAAELRSAAARG